MPLCNLGMVWRVVNGSLYTVVYFCSLWKVWKEWKAEPWVVCRRCWSARYVNSLLYMYTCIRGIYIACPCFWDEPERVHLLHSMAGSAMKVGGRSSRWLCSQALIQYIIAVCLLRFCTQWCAYCCHAWTKWLRTKIAAISLQSASTDYISNKTKASVQPCPPSMI